MKYKPCSTCVYKDGCGLAGNTPSHPCKGHTTKAESKKEMVSGDSWITFIYSDGSNPYIAKTEKEKLRIIKKHEQLGNEITRIGENLYGITIKKEGL